MGVLSSFNIGVSGINAIGEGMSVVGDNIANAATNGFKSSRPEFQDVLASSLRGVDGGDQIGSGTRLTHIKPLFSQGNIIRTEQTTDLAINGTGFFAVEANFGKAYSRDGSMHFNKDGFLVNSDEYKVLGFSADEKGNITTEIAPIRLGTMTIPARASDYVSINMNLDSRVDNMKFNPESPLKTSSYTNSVLIYDNVGTPRMVNVYFNKVKENEWEYHCMVQGEDAHNGEPGKPQEMAKGKLTFSNKGFLKEEIEDFNAFNFNKGAALGQKIKFDFGKSLNEGGDGIDASTQFGSNTTLSKYTQNGAQAATLSSISFNDTGVLTGVYSNGEMRDLGQVAVAKFQNNESLFKMGKNLYKDTRKSGEAALGKPGEAGRGEILAKSIEQSNVDIAQEFVNLITYQRNFTANTRSITTADQMLQDVLSIKR